MGKKKTKATRKHAAATTAATTTAAPPATEQRLCPDHGGPLPCAAVECSYQVLVDAAKQ